MGPAFFFAPRSGAKKNKQEAPFISIFTPSIRQRKPSIDTTRIENFPTVIFHCIHHNSHDLHLQLQH